MSRIYALSESQQVSALVAHFKAGRDLNPLRLWIAGIDYPMRLIAGVKTALRREGRALTKAIVVETDVAGHSQPTLRWSLVGKE